MVMEQSNCSSCRRMDAYRFEKKNGFSHAVLCLFFQFGIRKFSDGWKALTHPLCVSIAHSVSQNWNWKQWRNGTNFASSELNFKQIFIEMLDARFDAGKGATVLCRSQKFGELKCSRKWRIIKFDITYFLCFSCSLVAWPASAVLSNFAFFCCCSENESPAEELLDRLPSNIS